MHQALCRISHTRSGIAAGSVLAALDPAGDASAVSANDRAVAMIKRERTYSISADSCCSVGASLDAVDAKRTVGRLEVGPFRSLQKEQIGLAHLAAKGVLFGDGTIEEHRHINGSRPLEGGGYI